jgi:hypothetical protein
MLPIFRKFPSLTALAVVPWLISCDKGAATPASPTTSAAAATPTAATPPSAPTAAKPAVAPDTTPKAGISRGPYLQMATTSSINVVWRHRDEPSPIIKWGITADALENTATLDKGIAQRRLAAEGASSAQTLPLHSAPSKTKQFEAKLTGLEPDTKYYYAVFDGAKRLTATGEDYTFRTLPVPGKARPGWFWVAGDGGTGGTIQAAVHTAMVNFTKQKNITLDGFLHVGDMAYQSGLDTEFQGRFFNMYGDTMRHTVCWPAMGNHEGKTSKGEAGVGPYYDSFVCPTKGEAGGVASGREAYYSFDFGQIHFIVLDSCQEALAKKQPSLTALGDAMIQWLKADLEKSKAQWLIAYWHHPPYTKGSHDSDIPADYESRITREQFLPLLESAGVDLILSGHSHIYERSMLIDGAHSTPTVAANFVLDDGDGDPKGDGAYTKSAGLNPNEGFVAVVTGNAGTTLKRVGTIPLMKKIILEHGSLLFNVDGDNLNAIMLNKAGEQSDVFTITKQGQVPAKTRIASPKPAPPMPVVRTVKADGAPGEGKDKEDKAKGEKESKEPATGPDQRSRHTAPTASTDLIAPGATWKYLLNGSPGDWHNPAYNDSTWLSGPAGFGYGDDDDVTRVDVKGPQAILRIRHEFTLPAGADPKKLGLLISFDDAFIVYINGHEVTRSLNIKGNGPSADVGKPHEADDTFEYFPLDAAAAFLVPGKNIIGISGYNDDPKSSDFSLHPQLILAK